MKQLKYTELLLKIERLEEENKKLAYMAYHDIKYKIYNRNWLDNYKKMLDKYVCMVSFIDLNHLKKVNDTKGHNAGDLLIKKVIDIIKTTAKDFPSCLARWGKGDEFIFITIMPSETAVDHFTLHHKILKENLSEIACIGTCIKTKEQSLYKAMRLADKLLYEAKAKYKKNRKIKIA